MNGGHPGLTGEISHPVVTYITSRTGTIAHEKSPTTVRRIMFCRWPERPQLERRRARRNHVLLKLRQRHRHQPGLLPVLRSPRRPSRPSEHRRRRGPLPATAPTRKSPACAAASRATSIWTLRWSAPSGYCVFFWPAPVCWSISSSGSPCRSIPAIRSSPPKATCRRKSQ